MMDSFASEDFGAITGFIVLLEKFVAIYCLTDRAALGACLIDSSGMGSLVRAIYHRQFPYAKVDGKGKVWHDTTVFPIGSA